MRVVPFLLALLATAAAFAAEPLRVLAAVSLSEALKDAAIEFEQRRGTPVRMTFAASGTLALQVKRGGAGDVLISAAAGPVNDLIRSGDAVAASERVVARNALVLITPPDGTITSLDGLRHESVRRIALGEPKTVPAGDYAKQLLERLGFFEDVKSKIVYAADVRQVLAYVSRGDANAGIVYRTDARKAGDGVRVAATVDPTVVYPGVVLTRARDGAAAEAWLDYLVSPAGQRHFTQRGFITGDERAVTRPAATTRTAAR